MLILATFTGAACAGERPTLTDDLLEITDAAADDATTTAGGADSDSSTAASSNAGQADAAGSADSDDALQDSAPVLTTSTDPSPESQLNVEIPADVERLRVVVEETFPHDPFAFTQGLELYEGTFIESVGLYEQSDLRRVTIETGEVVAQTPAPDGLFAEGLTRVGDRLIQLTWKAGRAYIWDAASFNPLGEYNYDGQGWGLCFNGSELIMSDGSANLTFRNPETFEVTGSVTVLLGDSPMMNLNELECVNSDVYINIWMTDQIIRVNQISGRVNAVIDASDLAKPRPEGSNVLNGIAYDRDNDVFYLTGKLWPTIHRVRFALANEGN